MTIHSMTGFGSAEASHDDWAMKVECRSVNHRGLDVRVWAPRDWAWVEPFVLEIARASLRRGRVEVRVDVSLRTDDSARELDTGAFASVAQMLSDAARDAGLAPPTVGDVLQFDRVRTSGDSRAAPKDTVSFEEAIKSALMGLARTRAEEGARLRETMDGLLDEVARCVAAVEASAATIADEYRTRLEARIREALERFEVGSIDERAILQEVAIFADRSDVSEETQRAKSHIEKLREVIDSEETKPVGKQVDFYLQELFREANTTGSKSGSLEITNHVITMKTAIEKMREQAANIE